MLKRTCVILCVLFLLASMIGCFAGEPAPSPTPAPTATTVPAPAQTRDPKTDIWSDTTVFGKLIKIEKDTFTAIVAGEERVYRYDKKVKDMMDELEITEGSNVAIHFETDENGKYTAVSIEKIISAR